MSAVNLERYDASGLEIVANERDVLQDLAVYLDYMHEHSVKRMTRTNQLPKSDAQRIARLLGDREMEQQLKATGSLAWLSYLDRLALDAGLVSYDIKGDYVGYSSASPSFIDNFIVVNEKAYQEFLAASPAHQEKRLLNALVNQKLDAYGAVIDNEFYRPGVLGRLDPFSPYGFSNGVLPTLDFAAIRRFLFELLAGLEAGVWYSTASLVAYLKNNHRYFLIPEKIKPDRWGRVPERYESFHDGANRWGDKSVPPDAPDAFERVEGRYIERFLERIPLEMRFLELAYPLEPYTGNYPTMGRPPAFRLSERFIRLMKGQIEPPRVSVLPNFDVMVESEIYPLNLMRRLERLAERVSAPVSSMHGAVITLQLKKSASRQSWRATQTWMWPACCAAGASASCPPMCWLSWMPGAGTPSSSSCTQVLACSKAAVTCPRQSPLQRRPSRRGCCWCARPKSCIMRWKKQRWRRWG